VSTGRSGIGKGLGCRVIDRRSPASGRPANGRLRRISPVAARLSEGRFTQATAATQAWPQELVFIPLIAIYRLASESDRYEANCGQLSGHGKPEGSPAPRNTPTTAERGAGGGLDPERNPVDARAAKPAFEAKNRAGLRSSKGLI
jgi:hypothetical protein